MISLASTPSALFFSLNRERFRLASTPYQTAGTSALFRITLFDNFPDGVLFILTVGGRSFSFTKESSASGGDTTFSDINTLCDALKSNYYLRQLLSFSVNRDGIIEAAGLQPGLIGLTATTSSTTASSSYRFEAVRAGADPQPYDNYSVVTRFLFSDGTATPWTRHYPIAGYVNVDTDIINSYFANLSPSSTSVAPIKVCMEYAESYGTPALVGKVKNTDWFFCQQGELNATNLPDWKDSKTSVQLAKNGVRPFVLGEDNNIHCHITTNIPTRLWVGLFNTATGAATSATVTMTIHTITTEGSATELSSSSITLTNGSFTMVNVSPSQMNLPTGCTAYVVTLSYDGDDFFKRSFDIVSSHFVSHLFYFRNKYGILQPLEAVRVSTSLDISAEQVKTRTSRSYVVTDSVHNYSATTARITRATAEAFLAALATGEAYYMHGSQALAISVGSGSVSVWDESEDLATISFPFILTNQLPTTLPTRSNAPNHAHETHYHVLTEQGDHLVTEDGTQILWK